MEARKAKGMRLCGAGSFSAWPQRSLSSAQRRGLESEVRDGCEASDDLSESRILTLLCEERGADGGKAISQRPSIVILLSAQCCWNLHSLFVLSSVAGSA